MFDFIVLVAMVGIITTNVILILQNRKGKQIDVHIPPFPEFPKFPEFPEFPEIPPPVYVELDAIESDPPFVFDYDRFATILAETCARTQREDTPIVVEKTGPTPLKSNEVEINGVKGRKFPVPST